MRTIRKGTQNDISQIVKIYDHILDAEESGKMKTEWIRVFYPTEQTALDALKARELFVMEQDGCIAATARINQIQAPEYKNALWKYKDVAPEQIMVLHTLAVDPSRAGEGCGTEFLKFYEEYTRQHHCPYLRMDTNVDNQSARRLYAR